MNRFTRLLLITLSVMLGGCNWNPFSGPHQEERSLVLDYLQETNKDIGIRKSNRHITTDFNKIHESTHSLQTPRGRASILMANVGRCLEARGIQSETIQMADATNYGKRAVIDAAGNPIPTQPLFIILHETVLPEEQTLNLFRTPHAKDADQVSYHMLVSRDGRRIRVVPDNLRAFGAGNSAFGGYTVRLQNDAPGSINNVALHLSLVTPPDGFNDAKSHSGYTEAQYRTTAAQVLFWQVRYGIPAERVTTHKMVDRSGSRHDPRSFNWHSFETYLESMANSCDLQAYLRRS